MGPCWHLIVGHLGAFARTEFDHRHSVAVDAPCDDLTLTGHEFRRAQRRSIDAADPRTSGHSTWRGLRPPVFRLAFHAMNDSRTRALAGLLRTPAAEPEDVAVTLRWTEDELTLELSSGDVITAGRERLTRAAIWMRGAVTGTWAVPDKATIATLAVLADDDVTRIASGDFRRVVEMATEAFQDGLVAAQTEHETVRMMPPWDDEPVDIDQGLAELIAQLWARGCLTNGCCENQDGIVYIAFDEAESAERFLTTVAHHHRPAGPADVDDGSLYNRISDFGDSEPDDWQEFRKRRLWRLKAMVHEWGCLANGPDVFTEGEFVIGITVFFPRTDLDAALEAVRAANVVSNNEVTSSTFSA